MPLTRACRMLSIVERDDALPCPVPNFPYSKVKGGHFRDHLVITSHSIVIENCTVEAKKP
eukprot:11198940-Ditylum_brightwellii.AAC.1